MSGQTVPRSAESAQDEAGSFRRLARITTLAALILALGSGLVLGFALDFNPAIASRLGSIIALGPRAARLLRWGMILDAFGYYLLLAPLALYLWRRFDGPADLHVTLYTLCGLFHMMIGSIGAIVLSAALPPLMIQYAQADAAQRPALQLVFNTFLNAVFLGLWNPLEASLVAVWWLGIGTNLQRQRAFLGAALRVLGGLALLDAVGSIFGIGILFAIGVAGILIFPLWLIGIVMEMA